MGRTHKLPSPSRHRSGAMWQMTDNLQSGLRCSLWLGLTFFSHSIREFQDVLLKVQPWVGRMSSSWGSSAFDGGDHDNRVFTVSVSLHRITCKKLICLFLNTVCIVFIYISFCEVRTSGALYSNGLSRYRQNSFTVTVGRFLSANYSFLKPQKLTKPLLVPKVEGCPGGDSPATPRKRLHSAEEAQWSSRPPPEGAGSVPISESEEKGGFCQSCQKKVSELKKQALALADQNSLKVGVIICNLWNLLAHSVAHILTFFVCIEKYCDHPSCTSALQ